MGVRCEADIGVWLEWRSEVDVLGVVVGIHHGYQVVS